MKKNKIMAVAMLCSTFFSPILKAQEGTKQNSQKSDTLSDSDKNLQNILNKKSDNPQEMYNSRWKTSDIVKYIEYVLGTIVIGGVSIYVGKKGYNKYIRNSKFELKELEIAKLKEPKIVKLKEPKIVKLKEPKIVKLKEPKIVKLKEPKKVELTVELTKNSIAKKIQERLDSYIFAKIPDSNSEIMCKVYKKVVEDYKVQKKKDGEFQKITETKIPENNVERYDKQFITWFQELNNETLDILLGGLSDEEKQLAKDNFKFYSFVWVYDEVNFVIAFAPKDKKIDLNGKKGKEANNFDSAELFDENNGFESYNDILEVEG